MPATNLAQLLDPCASIEKAYAGAINAQLTSLPAFVQRDSTALPTQYVGVQCTTGTAVHRHLHSDDVWYDDAWPFTLQFIIHTVRVPLRPDFHGYLRGKLAAIITPLRYQTGFPPCHVLNPMGQQSGTESVEQQDDSDISALVFTGMVGIRTSAWPE